MNGSTCQNAVRPMVGPHTSAPKYLAILGENLDLDSPKGHIQAVVTGSGHKSVETGYIPAGTRVLCVVACCGYTGCHYVA